MKSSLAPGLAKTGKIIVDQPRTIDFMGEECRVYATPSLIQDIESLCRDFLLEHLDPGENSVGARIELDHLAPTLVGMPVELTAVIGELKGRLVTFEIEGRDSLEPIARGKHVRFIVDTAVTAERLKRKLTKAREAAK